MLAGRGIEAHRYAIIIAMKYLDMMTSGDIGDVLVLSGHDLNFGNWNKLKRIQCWYSDEDKYCG